MIKLINLTNYKDEMDRFSDREDVGRFCREHGCDGIELSAITEQVDPRIPMEMVQGVHLPSFNNWMDLWQGNQEALLKEFGSMEVVEQYYGGRDRQALLDTWSRSLDLAQRMYVPYVVFHVTEIKMEESLTEDFEHTDEEVVEAACELINELLDNKGYSFDFLMENLWWPGLNYRDARVTRKLLDGVHYAKKGLMLDTGHLMNSNQKLRTQEEGCEFIQQVLDEHEKMLPYIKGIHLHQSLSGEVVRRQKEQPVNLPGDYWEKWGQTYSYIFQVDTHQPFTAAQVRGIIDRVQPEYLTYELISRDREEHGRLLEEQNQIWFPYSGSVTQPIMRRVE